MHWSEDYIGLAYSEMGRRRDGLDCWGLARLVYAETLDIELPSYTDALDRFERDEIAAITLDARRSPLWRGVGAIEPFDVLLFRHGRHATHVGLAIDARRMLHVEEGRAAHIARYDVSPWRSRFVGAYRHAARLDRERAA